MKTRCRFILKGQSWLGNNVFHPIYAPPKNERSFQNKKPTSCHWPCTYTVPYHPIFSSPRTQLSVVPSLMDPVVFGHLLKYRLRPCSPPPRGGIATCNNDGISITGGIGRSKQKGQGKKKPGGGREARFSVLPPNSSASPILCAEIKMRKGRGSLGRRRHLSPLFFGFAGASSLAVSPPSFKGRDDFFLTYLT